MNKKRDIELDVLKFIGLIGLIASHTYTNKLILQVRSFDVNLLIIISAYLADSNLKNNTVGYMTYCKKRVKRLLIPTWIFITIYLLLNLCIGFQDYSAIQIVRSYLLMNNSIGYVWIIYVYLICAFLMPFLKKIDTNDVRTKMIAILGVIIYCGLVKISDNYWYQLIVLYPIIFGLISFVGILISRKESSFVNAIMISGICVFMFMALNLLKKTGGFVLTGEYKYPPKLYYLGYSVGISILLFKCKEALLKIVQTIKITAIVSFFSRHSLWIYLWHILALQIVSKFNMNQICSFLSVMIISVFFVHIQSIVVFKLQKKGVSDEILSLFRG